MIIRSCASCWAVCSARCSVSSPKGDFEAGKTLVEKYAVTVDPKLHAEVLTRYKALDIEPYSGFVNPQYELVEKNGKVVDVKVSYPNDYVKQMLEYSRDYSFLPNLN